MNRNTSAAGKTAKKGIKKENHRFAQGFERDDPEDRSRFIEHHLPLVISIARKRANQGVDFDDLVQEGIVGLITAAEKFDPSKGFRFSTYATWWIRQAIDDAVLKHGDTIKKPSNYASHLKHLLSVTTRLTKELGREPTTDEISRHAELDGHTVRRLLSLISGTVSLDAPVSDSRDQPAVYQDLLEDRSADSPADASISRRLRADISRALDELSDKERRIIQMRFGLDTGETKSLREVGRVFRLSPERIRQIEEAALAKLRSNGAAARLKEYLN